MARIRPKNWGEFQHYKDRNPVWIKLHKRLLDDYEFQCLPVASKALAPMLWLIASEDVGGVIDADPKKLGFRLRMTPSQVSDALNPLIEAGFFSVVQDASTMPAEPERTAIPEKETENKKETEKNIAQARSFDDFWEACPRKVGKGKARKNFETASKLVEVSVLIDGMRRYAASRKGQDEKFTVHPATWLFQERWADDLPPAPRQLSPEEIAASVDKADRMLRRGKYAEGYEEMKTASA